ncbi:F-box protein, partial [Trifolium medium]|nr:F-box protein [Trifolium medium]
MFRKNIVSKSHDDDDTCLLFNWLSGPVKLSFLSGSSVNGILCIYDIIDHTRVVLWNPATDKVNVIPPSQVFRPCYDFRLYGFGYDHVRDDYK